MFCGFVPAVNETKDESKKVLSIHLDNIQSLDAPRLSTNKVTSREELINPLKGYNYFPFRIQIGVENAEY